MSTMSSCPACCIWISCAAPMPTPRSSISTPAKRWQIPGVLAVITGEDLKKAGNLHWMPTLMSDTQMVLPIEKVVYYAQEVCASLPPSAISRPTRWRGRGRLRAAAGGGRSVRGAQGRGDRSRRQGEEDQPYLALGGRRQGPTDQVVRQAARSSSSRTCTSRASTSPSIETCGMVADYNKITGKLRIYMTSQAPHATARSSRWSAASPSINPDHLARYRRRLRRQGAGLSRLCLLRGRQHRHRQAGQMDRGSQRELAGRLVCARLSHHRRDGGRQRRHITGAARARRWPTMARPTRPPTRRSSRPACTASAPARTTCKRACRSRRRVHQQAARRRGLSLLVPRTEAVHMIERMADVMAHELAMTRPTSG